MIGLLIVAHCLFGEELLKAAEFIIGKLELIDVVNLNQSIDTEAIRNEIEQKLSGLNQGKGVIILTDMFGGTPSNISLSFLKEGEIEVLTGVNLPMLLSIAENRKKLSLTELAVRAQKDAKNSISIASRLLNEE